MSDPFMAKADDFIARLAADADMGPIDECETVTRTTVTYTFQSGVSVKVWQGPGGDLRHRVFDGGKVR